LHGGSSVNKSKENKDMDENIERRHIETELRVSKKDDDSPKLEGYAALFDELSEDLGGFREKIQAGAFKKSLKKTDVRALWNHDSNFVLGRKSAGTLVLKEDERGLKVKIDPPEAQWAKDLMTSIERGDVTQMSFGFRVIKDSWEEKGKQNIRTLDEVNLFDVSPVTFPAYPQTEIQARNLIQAAGIEYESIARVLVRVEHDLPLSDEDRGEIAKTVNILNALIPEVETDEGEADPTVESHQTKILRARLNLRSRLLQNKLEV
jgi:HK97 family phage prohead protease